MEGLQGPWEAVEEGPAGDGVGQGVGGRGEEVEGNAPVGEDGEVAELCAGLVAAA